MSTAADVTDWVLTFLSAKWLINNVSLVLIHSALAHYLSSGIIAAPQHWLAPCNLDNLSNRSPMSFRVRPYARSAMTDTITYRFLVERPFGVLIGLLVRKNVNLNPV